MLVLLSQKDLSHETMFLATLSLLVQLIVMMFPAASKPVDLLIVTISAVMFELVEA